MVWLLCQNKNNRRWRVTSWNSPLISCILHCLLLIVIIVQQSLTFYILCIEKHLTFYYLIRLTATSCSPNRDQGNTPTTMNKQVIVSKPIRTVKTMVFVESSNYPPYISFPFWNTLTLMHKIFIHVLYVSEFIRVSNFITFCESSSDYFLRIT